MQNPSWCLVVNTMYCCPANRARSTNASGSNFTGLKVCGSARYSASVIPPGFGTMMGQEASTLACEYGPQWMNIPNLALRYQLVRSHAIAALHPSWDKTGKQKPAAASWMNCLRLEI